ncbi:uncharacterized protein LOC123842810 isoform X1 [Mirounga angustirostris]|uniref:uncharacterized protein LOC123842810 isoform X1 n=1 Tax=Mirounga angustirostris TaxID=9716 RepID=UPI00313E3346
MKLFLGILLCSLVLGVSSQSWLTFLREAGQGARDMLRAYSDMREANYKNSDKYFHARGNYDAAQRGPGGVWAAKVIRCQTVLYTVWTLSDVSHRVFAVLSWRGTRLGPCPGWHTEWEQSQDRRLMVCLQDLGCALQGQELQQGASLSFPNLRR